MKLKKTCQECNKKFTVYKSRKQAKYCSNECRFKAQKTDKNIQRDRKTVKCLNCKTEFKIPKSQKQKFCKKTCYWEYRNKNPEIKIQSNQGINLINKTCINCNKKYKINKYRKKTSSFCSVNCHNEYRRVSKVCPTCKKQFKIAQFKTKKYCSEKCAIKGCSKRKSLFFLDVFKFIKKIYKCEDEVYLNFNKQKLFLDILLIDYNIVIECNGDYWHCNPNRYDKNFYHKQIKLKASEIWERDNNKKDTLVNNGYKVITCWECDWNNNDEFFNDLKNLIENEIYKNKKHN